jgi:hypothetical protein
MQNRIEEHPDYESKIQDDPIELLEKIKVLMHNPIRAKYPFCLTDGGIDKADEYKTAGARRTVGLCQTVQTIS